MVFFHQNDSRENKILILNQNFHAYLGGIFWVLLQNEVLILLGVLCKPKPCKAYRELSLSQFSQGKPCFHYREPCSHCRDPVFITGISLQNPVLPCTGLQCHFGGKPSSDCEFKLSFQVSYVIPKATATVFHKW